MAWTPSLSYAQFKKKSSEEDGKEGYLYLENQSGMKVQAGYGKGEIGLAPNFQKDFSNEFSNEFSYAFFKTKETGIKDDQELYSRELYNRELYIDPKTLGRYPSPGNGYDNMGWTKPDSGNETNLDRTYAVYDFSAPPSENRVKRAMTEDEYKGVL